MDLAPKQTTKKFLQRRNFSDLPDFPVSQHSVDGYRRRHAIDHYDDDAAVAAASGSGMVLRAAATHGTVHI